MQSASQAKRANRSAKFKAIRNELALIGDPDCRPYHGGNYEFDWHPTPIDDPDVSSRLYGPQMKAIQWEATIR